MIRFIIMIIIDSELLKKHIQPRNELEASFGNMSLSDDLPTTEGLHGHAEEMVIKTHLNKMIRLPICIRKYI